MKTIITNGFLLSLILLISCGRGSLIQDDGLEGNTPELALSKIEIATRNTENASVVVLTNLFNSGFVLPPLIPKADKCDNPPYSDCNTSMWYEPSFGVPLPSTLTTREYFSDYQFNMNVPAAASNTSYLVKDMNATIAFLCGLSAVHFSNNFPFYNGYPADGTYSATVTADNINQINQRCGYSSYIKMVPINYSVEYVRGTSFEKRITFTNG